MKKFFLYIAFLFLPVGLFVGTLFFMGDEEQLTLPVTTYQLNKIEEEPSIKTAFFGDSSCGHGIDANLVGEATMNLSLTGSFITRGDLDLLRFTHTRHPELENVYFMHTIDGYSRELDGRFMVFKEDINFKSRVPLYYQQFKDEVKQLLGRPVAKQIIVPEMDFLKQGHKRYESQSEYTFSRLSEANEQYILEIAEFCRKHQLNYKFLIGPNVGIKESPSFEKLKAFFNDNKIPFSEHYFKLDTSSVGDFRDHVRPESKAESTKFYKEILEQGN